MITEDLSAFLADFGVELSFYRESTESSSSSSSSSDTLVATSTFILDEPPSEVKIYDRSFFDARVYKASMATRKLTLQATEDSIAGMEQNDYTTINAIRWYVIGFAPDGTGFVELLMSTVKVEPV